MTVRTFTAILHREADLYVAECPEVGTVSQGYTIDEAIANLKEATELYLEEFPLLKSVVRYLLPLRQHVPNLRRVSGGETIRALERLGFVQVRQRGSHQYAYSAVKNSCTSRTSSSGCSLGGAWPASVMIALRASGRCLTHSSA